ncbi:Putative major royal jelly protein/protein yellow [Septoria linicola]|uniref:Major royal jelly protein/protein yellow n=1 Tax=Septoria linicola TaxID=215465 RepID=A0A9Q9EJU3_9PEZI|nr:putative major royal jelly protein/protein yellow [Septoria linicola]USW53385.1 Putative major royal jelly protein/protein yellow [Septoria linicola]
MRFANLSCALGLSSVAAQLYTGPEDPRVKVPTNGISTTPDERLFLVLARVDGSKGPLLVEYNRQTNTSTAYPNEEWNNHTEGDEPGTHFIRLNSQRVGPDGFLYAVDTGSPAFGAPVIFPEGPKLVQIDVSTNEVNRVYWMGNVTRANSLLNDVRFNLAAGKAYLTDAGSPGLIVLDLASGISRRVLESVPGITQGATPASAGGRYLTSAEGELQFIHADHLEVSPDGKWFYFQPANGGLNRVETKYLDQAYYNSSLAGNNGLAEYAQPVALTPATGGTAIDENGVIYVSDTDEQRILTIATNGTKRVLVQDPRLLWVDAMWINGTRLWMPAAQLNRGIPFGNGQKNVTKPAFTYTIDIGAGPPSNDHA